MNTLEETTKEKYLIRSDIFRLLSKGFSYPDENNFENIKGIINEFLETGKLERDTSAILKKILLNADINTAKRDYSRLFIKGAAPMTESHCCGQFNSVADVSAFYKAFGLNPKSGETPDAIMYELEFLSLLSLKFAVAPDDATAEITEDAYKKFINEHVSAFAEKFAEKLLNANPIPFYVLLSELLLFFLKKEKMRINK